MKTAEVELAFFFTCPNCFRPNFVKSVMKEFDQEEQEEHGAEFGEKPKTGEWVTQPETAECPGCDEEIRLLNPGELP